MTVERQERYGFGRQFALVALAAGLACAGLTAGGFAVRAATTERVVTARFSGLAIDGYDPVAYFVDKAAVLGLPDFEAQEAGVVWRFHNEGNRASFLAHPEIYGPQFGGYDPIAIAHGVTFAGNPHFFVVTGQRLYLFGLESNRDSFAANPGQYLPQAKARWPKLEETLAQ
jgi:YHS domain-containing protein